MFARIALTGLLVAALSATAEAQSHPQTREGFGISFGVGAGSAGLDCDGCDFDREGAFSGYLRLGGYARPTLFIGGETNGWMKEEDGIDMQASFVSAVALWYPQPASGFYLKGGLGFSNTSLSDDVLEIEASGLALSLGLGYDWRVTKNFSLTPYMNYLRSMGAEAKVNGTDSGETLTTDVLQVGLGFTWH